MTAQWYLLRGGEGHPVGPMPAEKLLGLALSGEASAGDLIWMEGMDVQITVERFLANARVGNIPDSPASFRSEWLSDVARNEIIERSQPKPNPDWLDEMRQATKSPPSAKAAPRPAAPGKPSPNAPAQKGFPVDWLGDVRQGQKPPIPSPQQAPPAAAAKQTSITDEFVIKGLADDWLEDIRQIEESLRASPAPTAPPPQRPIAAPQPPTAPPVSPEQRGYNPETGQITDPVAYERWQKAEAQRRQEELQKQPTVTVAEAFLDAQRAIQAWVDDDKNKTLVTSGDLETIRKSASVQEVLRRYEGYGPVMQEKLWKRLAFLVDNRKKLFKAFH